MTNRIMNRLMVFAIVLVTLYSCTKQDDVFVKNKELIGKWKLTEQLMDPGDGSGTYMPVDSDKTIEFFSNGTVVSNGPLCTITSDTGQKTVGVFYDDKEYIKPKGCDYSAFKIDYRITDSNLFLIYFCIEGCGQKFVKIN